MTTTQLQNRLPARKWAVCLFLFLFLGLSYFLCTNLSYQRDSELYVSGMITAGYQDLDLSGIHFGQNVFQVDGVNYGKFYSEEEEGFINTFVFNAQSFDRDSIQIGTTRNQQLGAQGWLAYYAGRICSLLSLPPKLCYILCKLSAVFLFLLTILAIGFQLSKAYGPMCGILFSAVSFLSIELQNFSSNLYWLPFTWFLPMLLGLICLNHPRRRFFLYPLLTLAIAGKCSFGYEYIPNIMLSTEIFLAAEFLSSLKQDRKRAIALFRTMAGVAISCLLGFTLVICLHGYLRGDGNILEGLRQVYEQDILRRTYGDASQFETMYADSLNASLLHVLLQYTFFSASGLLSLILLLANLWLYRKKPAGAELTKGLSLLLISFASSYAWFVLAKSHAYIHKFSDVLFFLPYIQIALFLLVQNLLKLYPRNFLNLFKTVQDAL